MGPAAGLERVASGKVRDVYAVDDDHLLLVASDRISAYDVVLPTPIPGKGRVLTALSAWWFGELADLVPHHLVAVDDPRIPPAWHGRAMLVRRLDMVPVECVARGYLAGSGLAEYRRTGSVCGIALPAGLDEGSALPRPIFTPATKAPAGGHDENIDLATVARLVGDETARQLERLTLAVYSRAHERALARGVVVADTKLEFGLDRAGRLTLADEVLTPDSSRLWPRDAWRPGRAQPSLDKQYVRDWLVADSGWDRSSGAPPPALPPEVVRHTRAAYVQAYERLTGQPFGRWPGSDAYAG